MSQVSRKLISTCKCTLCHNCSYHCPKWYIHISINKTSQNPFKSLQHVHVYGFWDRMSWTYPQILRKLYRGLLLSHLYCSFQDISSLLQSSPRLFFFLSFVFYTRIFPISLFKKLSFSFKSRLKISTRNNYAIYGERAFTFCCWANSMEFVPVTECKMTLLKQTSIRNATINWT